MDNNLAIILLNYNGYKDTINCINSIKKSQKIYNYKIIVVDNNSTDNSLEFLEKIENIKLIKSNSNDGFAAGNNIGIKYALDNNYKYILLLNNDTEIDSLALFNLLESADSDDKIGIMGARIMYFNNKELINYCGGKIDWLSCTAVHYNINQPYINLSKGSSVYTDFITGCCMLIKAEVFKNVGMLPEEYFMYYEDADFCVKVKEKGYELGLCENAIIYHKVSASSGGNQSAFSIKWATRNRMLFMKKYKKYTKGVFSWLFFYVTRIIVSFIYIFSGKIDLFKAMLSGIKEGKKIKI